MSRKFLFVGDLHADLECATRVAEFAKDSGCDEIIQVGDWGFLWPDWDAKKLVRELSKVLKRIGVPMRFCDGNHDFHPELRKATPNKDFNIAPFITYQFRGSIKEFDDGTTMVFVGGAPSIDRNARIRDNFPWWPEEYITQEDVDNALHHKGKKIDVLVTHDTAVAIPHFKETDDVGFNHRSDESHALLRKVLTELKPELHVHGHYHYRYETRFLDTKVVGLASNVNKFFDLYLIYEKSRA